MIKELLKSKQLAGGASLYIILLVAVFIFGFLFVSGGPAKNTNNSDTYVLQPNTDVSSKKNLQLKKLDFVKVIPPQGDGCKNVAANDEPIILVGSDPGPSKSVGASGKIRVWVNDELPPLIAPRESVNPATGVVTPGDRTAVDSLGNKTSYYLWEPAIYITSLTSSNTNGPFDGDAENGGKAYFPTQIKGDYNPNPTQSGRYGGSGLKGPPIDSDYINFENGPSYINKPPVQIPNGRDKYVAEYIWDVSSFSLGSGIYRAEFVIHDGDINLGISCINIQI